MHQVWTVALPFIMFEASTKTRLVLFVVPVMLVSPYRRDSTSRVYQYDSWPGTSYPGARVSTEIDEIIHRPSTTCGIVCSASHVALQMVPYLSVILFLFHFD